MILRKLLLAACFVTIVANVPAQPGRSCPAPVSDPLMKIWAETEGDWTATWNPALRPDLNPEAVITEADGSRVARYNGTWHKDSRIRGQSETAVGILFISIRGNDIEIRRSEVPNVSNTCRYRGTLNAAGTAVRGSYTCSYHPGELEWSARIQTPLTSMYCYSNEPRLSVAWHEQEGEWRGEWTPTGTRGQFTANFRKGRETTQATMTIDITEDRFHNRFVVKGRRTQTLGTCDYEGTLRNDYGGEYPDGWKVSGTYRCSWGGGKLPWGAVIGEGHP